MKSRLRKREGSINRFFVSLTDTGKYFACIGTLYVSKLFGIKTLYGQRIFDNVFDHFKVQLLMRIYIGE